MFSLPFSFLSRRDWRAAQIETGRVSQTSRAYDLMNSVLKTAVDDGILEKNPFQIRGGSTASTGKKVEPPTDAELDVILSSIDKRYKALVVLACGAGLRWGENTELRAKDVVVERDEAGEVDCVRISVSRQVVYTKKNGRDVGEVMPKPRWPLTAPSRLYFSYEKDLSSVRDDRSRVFTSWMLSPG